MRNLLRAGGWRLCAAGCLVSGWMATGVGALLATSIGYSQNLPRTKPIAFHVATNGAASNSGTSDSPFATLQQARDAVRRVLRRGVPRGGVTVWVHGGIYLVPAGFALDSGDSGTEGSPVVYRAVNGERPRIVGAMRVPISDLHPVDDAATLQRLPPAARRHVFAIHVPREAQVAPYPDIFHGNGGLFNVLFDDHILPLSRWPDRGYTTMTTVLDSGISPPHGGTFVYRPEIAEHMQRWMKAAQRGDLWLTGFWRVPFDVETVRVARIDPRQSTVTLAVPVPQGIGSKYTSLENGTRHGNGKEQYYASNLLEEINRPGQWSYDFKAKTLYLWPPAEGDLGRHELLLADTDGPVVRVDGAHDVQLIGLTVEGGIQQGVQVMNGERDLIAGNTLRNIGMGGIDVEGGKQVRVQSNDLVHLGSYGIHLVAGDRKTLTPGQAVADNNHISYIGEQDRITDGIFLDGVGNVATHNLIHDAPYNGIRYQGNDELMAYNEIHHIGLDAGDLGIFYTNGDWAAQGNRVEHNFGHDAPNANGSYLDDGATGRITTENVFYNLASGIFLGGGHDNQVTHNLILDCRIGIHVDNRGESRHYDRSAKHLTGFLQTIDPNRAPWSVRYPHFLDDVLPHPTEPLSNLIQDNLVAGAQTAYQVSAPATVDPEKNPSVGANAVIFDTKTLTLRPDVAGFAAVSMATAGLYVDAYRHTLPTDAETGRFVDRTGTMLFDSNVDMKASNKTQ